jgi:hypothetical protein
MAYQVDDSFDTWPEVIRAGKAAAGLYLCCGSWIARNTQDGLVPAELAALYGTREWIQKLVEVGLWETVDAGYRDVYYHLAKDGAKLNPTHEVHLARKEAARERTKRWRDASPTRHVRDTSRDTNASRDDSLSLPPSKEGKGTARPAGATRGPQQTADVVPLRGAQCAKHPGQPAHNCGPCRSERIGYDGPAEVEYR